MLSQYASLQPMYVLSSSQGAVVYPWAPPVQSYIVSGSMIAVILSEFMFETPIYST